MYNSDWILTGKELANGFLQVERYFEGTQQFGCVHQNWIDEMERLQQTYQPDQANDLVIFEEIEEITSQRTKNFFLYKYEEERRSPVCEKFVLDYTKRTDQKGYVHHLELVLVRLDGVAVGSFTASSADVSAEKFCGITDKFVDDAEIVNVVYNSTQIFYFFANVELGLGKEISLREFWDIQIMRRH